MSAPTSAPASSPPWSQDVGSVVAFRSDGSLYPKHVLLAWQYAQILYRRMHHAGQDVFFTPDTYDSFEKAARIREAQIAAGELGIQD